MEKGLVEEIIEIAPEDRAAVFSFLRTPLTDLNISEKLRNELQFYCSDRKLSFRESSIEVIVEKSRDELWDTKRFTNKSLNELEGLLDDYNRENFQSRSVITLGKKYARSQHR